MSGVSQNFWKREHKEGAIDIASANYHSGAPVRWRRGLLRLQDVGTEGSNRRRRAGPDYFGPLVHVRRIARYALTAT